MANQQHNQNIELDNPLDIEYSKPTKSRFKFLMGFFGFFIFAWAGCYNLYEHKFHKNYTPNVPDNTLYEPKYK
jgi:hypothetical protein